MKSSVAAKRVSTSSTFRRLLLSGFFPLMNVDELLFAHPQYAVFLDLMREAKNRVFVLGVHKRVNSLSVPRFFCCTATTLHELWQLTSTDSKLKACRAAQELPRYWSQFKVLLELALKGTYSREITEDNVAYHELTTLLAYLCHDAVDTIARKLRHDPDCVNKEYAAESWNLLEEEDDPYIQFATEIQMPLYYDKDTELRVKTHYRAAKQMLDMLHCNVSLDSKAADGKPIFTGDVEELTPELVDEAFLQLANSGYMDCWVLRSTFEETIGKSLPCKADAPPAAGPSSAADEDTKDAQVYVCDKLCYCDGLGWLSWQPGMHPIHKLIFTYEDSMKRVKVAEKILKYLETFSIPISGHDAHIMVTEYDSTAFVPTAFNWMRYVGLTEEDGFPEALSTLNNALDATQMELLAQDAELQSVKDGSEFTHSQVAQDLLESLSNLQTEKKNYLDQKSEVLQKIAEVRNHKALSHKMFELWRDRIFNHKDMSEVLRIPENLTEKMLANLCPRLHRLFASKPLTRHHYSLTKPVVEQLSVVEMIYMPKNDF